MRTRLNDILDKPSIAEFSLRKLKDGHKPLAVAKQLQVQLQEFTDWHPQDLGEVLKELYRTQVPLAERIEAIDRGPAVERSIARQMEVSTPRHVLEKMLFLTMERIEMEHGFEMEMRDGGEIFIVGREKTPSRLSPMLQREIELARKLAKDLYSMNDDSKTFDGSVENVKRETEGTLSDKVIAQLGRLAQRVLNNPDIVTEPIDVEFRQSDE